MVSVPLPMQNYLKVRSRCLFLFLLLSIFLKDTSHMIYKQVYNSKRSIKFPHTRDENTTCILLELDFSHLWINKIPQWRFTNFKYANATLSRLILITCFVMQILVHRTLMLSNSNCASCNTHVLCMNCIGFPYSGFIYGRHWRYFSSRRVIFHVMYAFSSSTEMNGGCIKEAPSASHADCFTVVNCQFIKHNSVWMSHSNICFTYVLVRN